MKPNFWKLSSLALAGTLGAWAISDVAQAERQPRMKVALKSLMTAEMNLAKVQVDRKADPQRAQSRDKALEHVRRAIAELKTGIQSGR